MWKTSLILKTWRAQIGMVSRVLGQTILVIFCVSESVALTIPNVANVFSQILTLQEAFETAAEINEERKRTEFDGAFCKNSNF